MLRPRSIRELKPWMKKVLFCFLCFLASGNVEIRNSGCFVSTCRGDMPGLFYASLGSVPIIAPSTLIEPWIISKQTDSVEVFDQGHLHILAQGIGIDPAKKVRSQAPEGSYYRPEASTYLVMCTWAQKIFLQHQLIVLLSIPWWLLWYEALRYVHKKYHKAIFVLTIIVTLIAFAWGLLVSFFPSMGGESIVTWKAILPWIPIEKAIAKDMV